jgi:hypothetical protein
LPTNSPASPGRHLIQTPDLSLTGSPSSFTRIKDTGYTKGSRTERTKLLSYCNLYFGSNTFLPLNDKMLIPLLHLISHLFFELFLKQSITYIILSNFLLLPLLIFLPSVWMCAGLCTVKIYRCIQLYSFVKLYLLKQRSGSHFFRIRLRLHVYY